MLLAHSAWKWADFVNIKVLDHWYMSPAMSTYLTVGIVRRASYWLTWYFYSSKWSLLYRKATILKDFREHTELILKYRFIYTGNMTAARWMFFISLTVTLFLSKLIWLNTLFSLVIYRFWVRNRAQLYRCRTLTLDTTDSSHCSFWSPT